MDSLPRGIRSAIRWCYVDMEPGFQSIRDVSFQRDHDQTSRFPPRGPSGFPFPRFDGTIKTLRLPAVHPAALRCLRLAVPSLARSLRSLRRGVRHRGPGAFAQRSGYPFRIQVETIAASHVPFACAQDMPREPSCAYALLYDPGGTDAPGHYDAPTRPPYCPTTRAPACNVSFEAQSHGLSTRCLRFAAPVTRAPRKTRFRLPASSAGRDWLPAGFQRKVSECYSSMAIILPSQAFVAQGTFT